MKEAHLFKVCQYLCYGLTLCILIVTVGCAAWTSEVGVENLWRNKEIPEWQIGKSTESDIIDTLGPPSQIISLNRETVFYYMLERTEGNALIFILWNKTDEVSRYDRAIFFFDDRGVLTKSAYSTEAISNE